MYYIAAMPSADSQVDITRGFLGEPPKATRYAKTAPAPLEVHGLVLDMVKPSDKVLDVGCGSGNISVFLRDERQCDVDGIEPDAERYATAAGLGVNMVGEMLDQPTVDTLGKYDAVLFLDVLEHIVSPFDQLELAKQLLKEDGRIIISVPNVAHWSVRLNLLRGRFNYAPTGIMDATHLRWFTVHTLQRLVERAGLEVDELRYSAGLTMPFMRKGPLKWLSKPMKTRLVKLGLKLAPRLFALQPVMAARLPKAT